VWRLLQFRRASDAPGLEDLATLDPRLVLGAEPAIDLANGGAAHPDADAGGQDTHAKEEEGRPAEWKGHAPLQGEEGNQNGHGGEQQPTQQCPQEGALPASGALGHRLLASHRFLGLLTVLDDVGDFFVAGDVVFELLQARRQLGARPAACLERDVVALVPFREDALEFHLTGGPVEVVPDQARVPLRDPPSLLRRGLGPEVDLGRLGVGDVECGKELPDGGLVAERRLVDAAGSRFVALGLGIELLALRLELLHLRTRVRRPAFEVRLRLPRCAQVAPQFLHLRLAVEGKHRETGVLLLTGAFLGERVIERVDPLQPVTRIL
jgi:hypothetical protein